MIKRLFLHSYTSNSNQNQIPLPQTPLLLYNIYKPFTCNVSGFSQINTINQNIERAYKA